MIKLGLSDWITGLYRAPNALDSMDLGAASGANALMVRNQTIKPNEAHVDEARYILPSLKRSSFFNGMSWGPQKRAGG